MKNFRKRLMIEVEETQDREEDVQVAQINSESKKIGAQETSKNENKLKFFDDEKHKIMQINNTYLNQILFYMENENNCMDLSYTWLNRIHNVNLLAKCIYVNTHKVMEKILTKRDFSCEFKLIKLMTEDSQHKNNFLKISRNLSRNNRYADILPYQHNVALIGEEYTGAHGIKGDPTFNDTYINASYIDGPIIEDNKFFIATQGPLSNTIPKFWRLIFSQNVKLIVMLCDLEEDSRKKCECYWPNKSGVIKQFEDVEVLMEKEETIINKCLIKREFIIRIVGIEKRVTQLQMVNWPDHSIPEDENGYNTLDIILNTIQEYRANHSFSPILTHCSAGTGRTGALVAIHNIVRSFNIIKLISLTQEVKLKPFFSVFNVVRKLREQRIGMVSSYTQYKFIYEFCIEWIKRNFVICTEEEN